MYVSKNVKVHGEHLIRDSCLSFISSRWITALKASINKWLPLHQAIQDFMNRPLEETRM